MTFHPVQFIFGLLAALVIAALAGRARSLSRSGMAAAVVIGTILFGLGGWRWAVLLLTFFLTSTALTRAFAARKRGLNEKFSKGGQRDLGQVFGNGGVAAVFALLSAFFPDAAWPWIGCAAALAAVNADTWATELGVLAPHPPRLITSGKEVEQGTSGGVSGFGMLAALSGALVIALPSALLAPAGMDWGLLPLIALCGVFGSLVDSLLGATLQAIYRCPQCEKETERHPLHLCGAPTVQIRGWAWLNNDLVNLVCGLSGALAALAFFSIL